MAASRPFAFARWLALGVPAVLLAGAYLSQYVGGLYPCEMCWLQRYAHFAALPFAVLGFFAAPKRMWVALAALAILASGLIGAYHAGEEYGWWEGLAACSAPDLSAGDPMAALMNAPLIRCDEVQWSLFGISLAGFNFLISTGAALTIFALLRRKAAR
jgi:disulfide bond formation protein DsbB